MSTTDGSIYQQATRQANEGVAGEQASSNTSSQTPKGYASRVKEHADRAPNVDIHSGANYRALAGFLNKPYTERQPHGRSIRVEAADSSSPPLVCVHSVVDKDKPTTKIYRLASDCDEFALHPPLPARNESHLIWLSGFPAPEWINEIGAQYRVDPEFFRRHLIFLQSKDTHGIAATPSHTQMITIRLTTICRRPTVLSRVAVNQARDDAAEFVRQHQQRLRVGDSIVRKYSVLDNTLFTLEQELAVTVLRSKQHSGWIAVICSDLGKDLTKGPRAHWMGDGAGLVPSCEPVVMHVPKLALERPPRPRASISYAHAHHAAQMTQNASLLAETFRLPPASDALGLDVRETLHSLFAFAAAAERQYLSMMQSLVDRELQIQSADKRTEWTLSNLRYFKSDIDDHIVNLEDTLAFLRRDVVPSWTPLSQDCPTPPVGSQSYYPPPRRGLPGESSASRLSLVGDDYAYLLQHAIRLSRRCVENTTILMNMAMLEESKKAIAQANGLTRLTILAFFFLPLSLSTSIFGMNFREFGTGDLSIWVCIVVAVPIVSLSALLCFWDWIRSKFPQRSKPKSQ